MNEEVTLTELGKTYGYSVQAVMKWKERGMPYNTNTRRAPKEKAIAWILENIINPLREVDVQAQIQQEKLRKARGEADAIELKNRVDLNDLIPLSYVEAALSGFCSEVRQTMMQIATVDTLTILEAATDQRTLKEKLRDIIGARLNEIGDIMLSPQLDEYDIYSEDTEESEQEEKPSEFDV
ncbi:terminase small subunit [Salmonella enterica]|nr:terminase small subunit [Salmonella enterica]